MNEKNVKYEPHGSGGGTRHRDIGEVTEHLNPDGTRRRRRYKSEVELVVGEIVSRETPPVPPTTPPTRTTSESATVGIERSQPTGDLD